MSNKLSSKGLLCALALALFAAPALVAAQSPAVEAARAAAADYDRDGARTILTEACDSGDKAACRSLLGQLDRSFDDEDEVAARALASDLCDSGDVLGCITLVRYAGDGDGGDIDQPLQRETAIKACRAGVANACYQAGQMTREGEGGPQDRALSAELLELACEGNSIAGCQLYADILVQRGWDASDEAETTMHWSAAREVMARACELGDGYSCTQFAEMMIEGRGGEVDRPTAMALLEQTCLTDQYQCREWLKYHAP